MGKFDIIFYEDSKGNSPVFDFIKTLQQKGDKQSAVLANSIYRRLDRLRQNGTMDGMPDFEFIDGRKYRFWQIRIMHVSGKHRIFICPWKGSSYVVLNHFIKKRGKTPPTQILLAETLMEDFIKRMGNK